MSTARCYLTPGMRGTIIALGDTFPSRYGKPVIAAVDARLFTRRYFTQCLACGFCHDQCCSEGVDVDLANVRRFARHADALERYTGVSRSRWFSDELEPDDDAPGGGFRRTAVVDGRCVFLNPAGRGCLLHRFCLERGIDYHELKSMVDCLFPVSFYDDVLCPSDDVTDGSLICLDTGPTLYRGAREEIRYYFGDGLVEQLDERELPNIGGEP